LPFGVGKPDGPEMNPTSGLSTINLCMPCMGDLRHKPAFFLRHPKTSSPTSMSYFQSGRTRCLHFHMEDILRWVLVSLSRTEYMCDQDSIVPRSLGRLDDKEPIDGRSRDTALVWANISVQCTFIFIWNLSSMLPSYEALNGQPYGVLVRRIWRSMVRFC
jgi:hypothetical protein